MNLTSIAYVKSQLHIDSTDADAWLAVVIPAISVAVQRWVNNDARLMTLDSNGDPILDSDGTVTGADPTAVLAVMVEVAYQYRFREGAAEQNMADWYAQGYTLNMSSVALLQPLHKPLVT